jgi:hypothetical protein
MRLVVSTGIPSGGRYSMTVPTHSLGVPGVPMRMIPPLGVDIGATVLLSYVKL